MHRRLFVSHETVVAVCLLLSCWLSSTVNCFSLPPISAGKNIKRYVSVRIGVSKLPIVVASRSSKRAWSMRADDACVSCQCGKTSIRFIGSRRALHRLKCCCSDCRAAADWGDFMAGRPKEHGDLKPFDASYWANDLEVLKGKEHLKPLKVKEAGTTTRIYASCCYSLMIGDHPLYKQRKVSAPSARIQNVHLPSPELYVHRKDLPDEVVLSLPPLPFTDRKIEFMAKWWAAVDSLQELDTRRRGISIQTLIDEIGPVAVSGPPPRAEESTDRTAGRLVEDREAPTDAARPPWALWAVKAEGWSEAALKRVLELEVALHDAVSRMLKRR